MRIAPVATDCAVSAAACAAALMLFGLGTFWLVMRTTMTHNVPTVCHFRRPGARVGSVTVTEPVEAAGVAPVPGVTPLRPDVPVFTAYLAGSYLSARPNERVTS